MNIKNICRSLCSSVASALNCIFCGICGCFSNKNPQSVQHQETASSSAHLQSLPAISSQSQVSAGEIQSSSIMSQSAGVGDRAYLFRMGIMSKSKISGNSNMSVPGAVQEVHSEIADSSLDSAILSACVVEMSPVQQECKIASEMATSERPASEINSPVFSYHESREYVGQTSVVTATDDPNVTFLIPRVLGHLAQKSDTEFQFLDRIGIRVFHALGDASVSFTIPGTVVSDTMVPGTVVPGTVVTEAEDDGCYPSPRTKVYKL